MHRLVAIVLVSAVAAFAQTNRGSIAGTVTDPSSAVVPGAVVKVTNIGTNEVRTVTVAGNGAFSVADLEPVEYRLEISAQGFKKEVIDKIKVDTASDRHREYQTGNRVGGYEGDGAGIGGDDRHLVRHAEQHRNTAPD